MRPLKGDGRFEAATLKLIAPLVGTRAVVDGRAVLTSLRAGTVGAPLGHGQSRGDESLRIESPQYGRAGCARGDFARRADRELAEALGAHGGAAARARLTATGTIVARRASRHHGRLACRELPGASIVPTLRLKVDGKGTVGITADHAVVRGALAAREGYFEFEKQGAPKLGNDVVVVGRPRAATAVSGRPRFEAKLLDLDVQLDFGDRMHIVGAGIDTMLGRQAAPAIHPAGG
jgi:translocation and assembly module TamB